MLLKALKKWTEKFLGSDVNANWEYFQEGQRHEIEDGLYSVFEDHGVEGFMETGTSPAEYLPSIVAVSLGLIKADDWKLESITSNDGWMTADVVLRNQINEAYKFSVLEVEDSDWVSFDVFTKLNLFARLHADLALLTLCSDDPYRVLGVSHEGLEEFESIVKKYGVPAELSPS